MKSKPRIAWVIQDMDKDSPCRGFYSCFSSGGYTSNINDARLFDTKKEAEPYRYAAADDKKKKKSLNIKKK